MVVKALQTLEAEVRGLTGRKVRVEADPFLDTLAKWDMSYELDGSEPHHVVYKSDYEQVAPALVAHELTHILRFYKAPEPDRRVAYVSASRGEQIAHALWRTKPWIPCEIHRSYVYDTVRHLVSTPPDIFIERYLYHRFPDLRPLQRLACEDIVFDTQLLILDRLPEKLASPIVYETTTALNAAYARALSQLFDIKLYVRPYYGTRFDKLSKQLLAELGYDEGYPSDRKAADRWAEILGLPGWYEWISLEQATRIRKQEA